MSRSSCSSPSELLFGPLQLAAVFVWLGLNRFQTQEAAIVAAALGVGDGLLAPLVGLQYGRHRYTMPLSDPKTMEGSLVGVFLGTCIGIYLFLPLMGLPLLPLRIVLVYAVLAAVAEGGSPGQVDNLMIPVVMLFSASKIQELLLRFET